VVQAQVLVGFSPRYVNTPRIMQFQLNSSTDGENLSCERSISYCKARHVNVTRKRKIQAMCDLINIEALSCDRFSFTAYFTRRSPREFVPGTGWSPGLEAKSVIRTDRFLLLQSQMSLHAEYVTTPAARSASHRFAPVGLGTLNRSMHTIMLDQFIQCPGTIHES